MPAYPVIRIASSTLSSISTMLDKILQPLLSLLPAYYSNSNQVIYQLNKILKKLMQIRNSITRYYLVMVNTTSMCVNMLKDEIITNI